ncbi:MAG: DUF3150 domain-containing protein [Deltaproteobacteria bacterium]|jgi:hypothetical protein|nr:DUF3150 domain-containing protein [Deltaproteobacteria bacterium]
MSDFSVKILDKLTMVNLSVSIWSAKKKLIPEDFGAVILPPEDLASLGNKRICDPERLKIFSTLKARAVGYLDKVGVRFLGGWGISDLETQAVHEFLLKVKNEFLAAIDKFIDNYDDAVKSWIDKHRGWERLIEESRVNAHQVRLRFSFSWQFFKVVPPSEVQAKGNLQNEVDNLGSKLFGEIAKEAQSIWTRVFAGKTVVSHKALSPLKTIRDKLMSLSFVEATVVPVVSLIDETILSLPQRGLIKGQSLLVLQGLVLTLRDSALLYEYGQNALGAQPAKDGLSEDEELSRELEGDFGGGFGEDIEMDGQTKVAKLARSVSSVRLDGPAIFDGLARLDSEDALISPLDLLNASETYDACERREVQDHRVPQDRREPQDHLEPQDSTDHNDHIDQPDYPNVGGVCNKSVSTPSGEDTETTDQQTENAALVDSFGLW